MSIRESSHFLNVPREFPVIFFSNLHKVLSANKPQTSENITLFPEESIREECSLGQ